MRKLKRRKPAQIKRDLLIAAIKKHAAISVTWHPEDLIIEGNASAIGEKEDAETNKWIHDQLDAGNEWAWCSIEVTVNWHQWEGRDYLGACSYKSEADFRADAYFTDMVQQACTDLADKLIAANAAISELLAKR